MARRMRWGLGPGLGTMTLAGVVSLGMTGCDRGNDGGGDAAAPEDVRPPQGESPGSGEPLDEDEIVRRAMNAAAIERQRETLIDELADLPTSRFTTAADVMALVPRDEPPMLFRLDESDLQAMPSDTRYEAIARYDRIARGLRTLAARAIEEAEALEVAGEPVEARDLLVRVRDLAAVNSRDETAELGRDAARAVVAMINEALAGGG